MEENLTRCKRCIMPSTYPGIHFQENGVCNFCLDFDHRLGRWYLDPKRRERAKQHLSRVISSTKSKRRKYDCIVPTSGGRDSLYVLHLCKTEYGFTPLVFTIDNGFWAPEARQNLENVVKKLNLDHMIWKPDGMADLYRLFLRETRDFCAPCNYFIFHKTAEIANQQRIPLVVMGGCQRLDTILPIAPDPWIFRSVINSNLPSDVSKSYSQMTHEYFQYYALAGNRLQPLDYIDWNYDDRRSTMERIYGIRVEDEHSDCLAHDVVSFISSKISKLRKFGMTYTTLKYSQLIRNHLLTREEALIKITKEDREQPPESLASVLNEIGIDIDELNILVTRKSDINQYIKFPSRLSDWWRKISFQYGIEQSRFFPDF